MLAPNIGKYKKLRYQIINIAAFKREEFNNITVRVFKLSLNIFYQTKFHHDLMNVIKH